jgi:dolichyl-phosphooligosaccharide-protein glycotransferase
MDSTTTGWWHRHGWTVGLLLAAFGFSFAIRSIWSYPVIAQFGPLFTYAGGSDSFYHSRVTTYIILTNHNLIFDPMLRFPVGSINPREPLFDWMNAILGLVFAPAFGGNAVVAGAWFLDLQAPLWAALGVFPVYLIGREVSGRRTGLIAALIFPFLSANIDSSTFGYANYLSFYTFMILVVVYSYIRTVKAVGNRRWIASYRDIHQYLPGLRGFLRTERTAVKWSVFTGVALGALALSWQGYSYAVLVIGLGILVAMLAERIRRVDSFGLYIATWIIGLVAFPMAAPYYLAQHAFGIFFDVPILLYFGVLGLLLPFLLMRDVPWVFSIPALVALVGAAALFLKVVIPSYFSSIVTGEGYFVKTLVYSTVAEAQAPSIDALVIGYGIFSFFLAFIGLAIFAFLLVRHRFKRYHVVFLVFAVVSIYLPISATKFFLLGSPAFALLSAEAIHRALDIGGYPELRRTVASLSDRGSQLAAFRRAFKARHVLVIALVAAILLPNIWIAVDAGIPGNTKNGYAEQVANSIPNWLKLNASAPATNYLGAAGSSLDTANQYDSAAYNWLATQDTNLPPANRPAFVSWWDYGFQAIDQGQHPSVADNFQNGIDPAGQFLLAQNESLAIAVLATTLLQSEQKASGLPYLPAALNERLTEDGVNVTALHNLLVNQTYDYGLVVGHPEVYLPVDPNTITDDNAMYLAVSYYLADHLSLAGVSQVYNTLQGYTGWSIRYSMADSRLFPFSGTDTGIFYAPADLTGRVISPQGIPTTFFNVTAVTTTGAVYPIGHVPSGVGIETYQINYSAPFYSSMIYRTYIGYNGTDVGQSAGIPGLEGGAVSDPIQPGWMLQHFEVVYKTAYYCPNQLKAPNGSRCFVATNEPTAKVLANETKGSVDTSAISYFQGGETMLAYYPGQTLLGTVSLADGTPDPGVRATVYDSWGIPHMSATTAADGTFSLVLPPGNDTVNLTTGSFDAMTQGDSDLLKSLHISVAPGVGFGLNAPSLVERYTVPSSAIAGFVYWNVAGNASYQPSADPVINGAFTELVGSTGTPRLETVTDSSGAFEFPTVPPGNYRYTIRYAGHTFPQSNLTVALNATINATAGLTPSTVTGTLTGPNGVVFGGATVGLSNASGLVASVTSGSGGNFSIGTVAPGNYTLAATAANGTLRSAGAAVAVPTTGSTITQNLQLEKMAPVAVEVLASGTAVAGIPVRFTPIVHFGSSSAPALATLSTALTNGTVAVTTANGVVVAYLPVGNYSVYAVGYVGGVVSTALGSVNATTSELGSTAIISLTPAVTLTGSVAGGPPSSSSVSTRVLVYGPPGTEVLAAVGSDGSFAVPLPAGAYSVLALEGATTAGSPTYAALGAVRLSAPTSLTLRLSPAIETRFSVGTSLPSGAFFDAAHASVTVSAGPAGPAVSAAAGSGSAVAFFLPGELPLAGSGYCVNASAPGYQSTTTCGISPAALANLTRFALPLTAVPVTLTVVGMPTGTVVTVNLTAESPTAVNRTYTGGPAFSFSLPPGNYGVGAEAVIGKGTVVYLPATILNTTVPFGASSTRLTLYVVPAVNATGLLSLPAGLNATNVSVTLSSPQFNVTVNGTDFTTGFHVAPGSYTATVTGFEGSSTYANLTRVTVSAGGSVSPKLVLNVPGVRISGLFESRGEARVALNTTVTLVGPGGAALTVTARAGSFGATLPRGTSYQVYANGSVLSPGPNGSYFTLYSTAPGSSCSVGATASTCLVTVLATTESTRVAGTLVAAPGLTLVPGEVRLIGPYPATNLTILSAPDGTFNVSLQPGAYNVYATSTSGPPYSTFGQILALPGHGGNVTVELSPGWVDSITVAASNQTGATQGSATLGVTDAFGQRTTFLEIAPGATTNVILPGGSYTLTASAPAHLNGVNGTASGSADVLVHQGNLATLIPLVIPAHPSVAAVDVGPSTATIQAGGSATFSFAVRSIGNVPVTVHPIGSPAFWSFNFSWANTTLVPGGGAVAGQVRITVPPGTAVVHAPITIQFALASGTIIGAVEPGPTLTIEPYYGVAIGRSGVSAPVVAPSQVEIPFFVANRGNAVESVAVTVVDAGSLASLGWTVNFVKNSAVVSSPFTSLAAGSNQSYLLNLSTTQSVFVIPRTVTLEASVTGVSGTYTSTVTLGVPLAKVVVNAPGGNALTVTGPGVGAPPSALPEWTIVPIAFAPAIALVIGVSFYRWWRTRKWTRR